MSFNAAFKKWFKNSKCVDSHGNPVVMYHGTPDSFTKFDTEKTWLSPLGQSGGLGFFFTDDPKAAAHYANRGRETGVVMPVYMSIQNPVLIEKYTENWDRMLASKSSAVALRRDLMERGYDGAITELGEWIAFKPSQVKSAIGNDGSWDTDDGDIRSNPEEQLGYMEIGHELNGVLWVWKNGKLEDSTQPKIMSQADPDKRYWYKGLPTHSGLWDDHTRYWRGRFDPDSGVISAVGPDFTPRGETLPVRLQNALYSRFESLKFSRYNPRPKR